MSWPCRRLIDCNYWLALYCDAYGLNNNINDVKKDISFTGLRKYGTAFCYDCCAKVHSPLCGGGPRSPRRGVLRSFSEPFLLLSSRLGPVCHIISARHSHPVESSALAHVTPEVSSSRNICFFSEGGETNRPIVTPVSVLISSPLAFRTGWNYRGRVKGK